MTAGRLRWLAVTAGRRTADAPGHKNGLVCVSGVEPALFRGRQLLRDRSNRRELFGDVLIDGEMSRTGNDAQ